MLFVEEKLYDSIVKKAWLHRSIVSVILLGALAWIYTYSFDHAYARSDKDNPSKLSLVILGISFPYNSTSTRIFSTVYWPLLEHMAAAQSPRIVSGSISYPNDHSRIVIKDTTGQGIGLVVPLHLWQVVNSFKQGAKVDAVYGYAPAPESPFRQNFRLISIAANAQN